MSYMWTLIFQPWLNKPQLCEFLFSFSNIPPMNPVDMDCYNNLLFIISIILDLSHSTLNSAYFSNTQTQHLQFWHPPRLSLLWQLLPPALNRSKYQQFPTFPQPVPWFHGKILLKPLTVSTTSTTCSTTPTAIIPSYMTLTLPSLISYYLPNLYFYPTQFDAWLTFLPVVPFFIHSDIRV